jgi:hypothetical protein
MLNCLQGGLDPTCLFKCASTNPSGALQASAVLQCVAGNCGSACISAFGGGGPGGGGSGGSGGSGGGPPQRDAGGGSSGGGRGGPRAPQAESDWSNVDEASLDDLQLDRNAMCATLATLATFAQGPELACSSAQRVVVPVRE